MAVDPNITLVALDDFFGNIKAHAKTGKSLLYRIVDLIEAIKNSLLVTVINTDTLIGDTKNDFFLLRLKIYVNIRVRRRVFDCV